MDIRNNSKIDQYLKGPFRVMLLLIPVDIVIFFFSVQCGIILAVFIVLCFTFQTIGYYYSKNEIMKECMGFVFEQGQVQNYLIHELPIPYALLDGDGIILWSNAAFQKIAGSNKGKHLNQIFHELNKNLLPSDVSHTISHINYVKKEGEEEKKFFYKVEFTRIRIEDFSGEDEECYSKQMMKDNSLVAAYFFDQTLLKKYMEQNENQRMVIGLIYIDNYDEVMDDVDEVKRSMLVAMADRKINKFIQNVSGIVKKTEKDKYFVVFEQKYLDKIKTNKWKFHGYDIEHQFWYQWKYVSRKL